MKAKYQASPDDHALDVDLGEFIVAERPVSTESVISNLIQTLASRGHLTGDDITRILGDGGRLTLRPDAAPATWRRWIMDGPDAPRHAAEAFHRLARTTDSAHQLAVIGPTGDSRWMLMTEAPREFAPFHRTKDTIVWPNGVHARIIHPDHVDVVRGLNLAGVLVLEWPSEKDWQHAEMSVRVGAAQIIAALPPPGAWGREMLAMPDTIGPGHHPGVEGI